MNRISLYQAAPLLGGQIQRSNIPIQTMQDQPGIGDMVDGLGGVVGSVMLDKRRKEEEEKKWNQMLGKILRRPELPEGILSLPKSF